MAGRVDGAVIALLALVGFGSSFIDSQVGGGGVISLPALLLAGLPSKMALGTNKLGGTASALVASSNYLHKGAVPVRHALIFAPLAFVGGAVGVWAVLHSDATWLVPAVIVVMAAMAVYVLVRPRFGAEDTLAPGLLPAVAMGLAALDIGTYDGILGPGTGSMAIFALVGLLGYGFRRAAALGRVLNLASNVSALGYWIWAGQVDWQVGIPMAAAMGLGGYVGSHTTLRHGEKVVKPLFEAITLMLLVSLAYRFAHGQAWV
ncbi:MAG: TSUP family transporter [bacterium]